VVIARASGALAAVPAFFSVALVDLARLSEVVKTITLLLGCAISSVMLIYWVIRVRKERAAEKLAELTLAEAESKAKQVLKDAEEKAAKMVTEAASRK
jgi:cell division septum initiation protein DivIVA